MVIDPSDKEYDAVSSLLEWLCTKHFHCIDYDKIEAGTVICISAIEAADKYCLQHLVGPESAAVQHPGDRLERRLGHVLGRRTISMGDAIIPVRLQDTTPILDFAQMLSVKVLQPLES